MPEHRYAWFGSDGEPKAGVGHVLLDRAAYEGGEVTGSGVSVEELEDADPETGSNWTIRPWQSGLVTEIDVYVGS